VGAIAKGFKTFDPGVDVRGVIFNRISGKRHLDMLEASIEGLDLVSLGGVPRSGAVELESRHLGLVPPAEHECGESLRAGLLEVARYLDLDRIYALASAVPCGAGPRPAAVSQAARVAPPCIGYLRDTAFTFYYPDNLEALEQAGAELVRISALDPKPLPDGLDALYIGAPAVSP
jgi:cobyrinic acid a,c-diamide synthase